MKTTPLIRSLLDSPKAGLYIGVKLYLLPSPCTSSVKCKNWLSLEMQPTLSNRETSLQRVSFAREVIMYYSYKVIALKKKYGQYS